MNQTQQRDLQWKIHCSSPPEKIFSILTSNRGRKGFWAESAEEVDGKIHFLFPNDERYTGKIIKALPHSEFSLIYFDSLVTFLLRDDGNDGTDLTLIHYNIPIEEYENIKAGWVSVLLALKAFADFGIDIRNHNKDKTWTSGYIDN